MSKVILSETLLRGVNAVNNDVAHEIEFEGTESYEEQCEILAEVCIDAGRLTTWGHPEADAEVKALIAEHGYPAVLRAVAEHVSL